MPALLLPILRVPGEENLPDSGGGIGDGREQDGDGIGGGAFAAEGAAQDVVGEHGRPVDDAIVGTAGGSSSSRQQLGEYLMAR